MMKDIPKISLNIRVICLYITIAEESKRSDIGLTKKRRSSYKGRKVDALALGAEEGRDKLRKAAGSCT